MPDDIDLRDLRNVRKIIVTTQCCGNDVVNIHRLNIELWKTIADTASLRTLEDQSLILSWM